MNRRKVLVGLSGLVTAPCACIKPAGAANPVAPAFAGCRSATAGAGGAKFWPMETSGNPNDDWLRSDLADQIGRAFGVRPSCYFYDDRGSPNARAAPEVTGLNGPDGTVIIGAELLAKERKRRSDCEARASEENRLAEKDPSKTWGTNILEGVARVTDCAWWSEVPVFIVAHEFGHILQYKKGMQAGGAWQMEPHADYLAGWFLASRKKGPLPNSPFPGLSASIASKGFERAIAAAFELGDTLFDDPRHHGTPELRATMVVAGYQTSHLPIDQAFDTGRRILKLD